MKEQHAAKNKKKKAKGKKTSEFVPRDYYFSFVGACHARRVTIEDFKKAIAKIRHDNPPSFIVELWKRANLHVRSSDEGHAFVVDFLIRHKKVVPQPIEDLTFDEEFAVEEPSATGSGAVRGDVVEEEKATPPGSGPVRRHASNTILLPKPKRTRLEYTGSAGPLHWYLQHMLQPYCESIMQAGFVAKGIRLQDLLSPQVVITHSCITHPHVSLSCITHPHVSLSCIT